MQTDVTVPSAQSAIPQKTLFGVRFALTNYAEASDAIIAAAASNCSFGVSALAVHGLIEAHRSAELRNKINRLDMVVPDGQPIRWVLNHGAASPLRDRVYGPLLTLHVMEKASRLGLRVFLFGSRPETLDRFAAFIKAAYPGVVLTGMQADRFREASAEEDDADIATIRASGAQIVLVGRGCPRQEQWVADHLDRIPAAMMAVGAAFDFHAGVLRQAPEWMQRNGLEWLFRLIQEPTRLWKRYLVTNSYFIFLWGRYLLGLSTDPKEE